MVVELTIPAVVFAGQVVIKANNTIELPRAGYEVATDAILNCLLVNKNHADVRSCKHLALKCCHGVVGRGQFVGSVFAPLHGE